MKKSISFCGIASFVMLLSLNATAKITNVEDYEFSRSGSASSDGFKCENISGMHSSVPSGYICNSVTIQKHTCYTNCYCNYSYTESNCKNGTLSGGTCDKNGVTYHEKCVLCTNTVTADNCSSPQGSTCTKDGVTYYESCGCNYTYQSSNCSGTLGGNTCMRDGVTYYQSCQANPPCNYTWTSDNCSTNKLSGNTCTKNNKTYYENCNCNYSHTTSNCTPVGGDSCTKNGVTYYQSCNCNNQYSSTNCTSLAGNTCKRNNKIYYSICNDQVCDYDYYKVSETDSNGKIITYSNCNGNLGGNTCQASNGVTLYETCTPCAGNYPYSYANCARPSGNTCTPPDYYDSGSGSYDNTGGVLNGAPLLYYQSCDSSISTDCNPGDWVYRIVGYYDTCSDSISGYGSYYPECISDGNHFQFRTVTLKDVGANGVHHQDLGQNVPLPPFVCVSPSASLTSADLAVWDGTSYGPVLSNFNGDPDQFVPAVAPLTYGVDTEYYGSNIKVYGGYKLAGIYLDDGIAVDISGWPCNSNYDNTSDMRCQVMSQWFGSKGISYATWNNNPESVMENQWGDSSCGSISNQACNDSGNCVSQNDINAISCVSGSNAGLINTLHNGERSFSFNVVDQYIGNIGNDYRVSAQGMVYPANLCLGKNMNTVKGYSVTNSSSYS